LPIDLQAIGRAITLDSRAIVLIAGKGHENYQGVRGLHRSSSMIFKSRRRRSRNIQWSFNESIVDLVKLLNLGAAIFSGDRKLSIDKISTDRATLKRGEYLLRCMVKNFDGHNFN